MRTDKKPCVAWHQLALVLLLFIAAMPVNAQTQVTHVVQPGENLFRIALYYGTTVDAIVAANGLPNVYIYVGQRLIIPDATITEAPDEALTPPGEESETDSTVETTDVHARSYVMQSGDTLITVAARLTIPQWALIDHNGLATRTIIAGQQLLIPEQESIAEESPTPEPTPETLDPTPTPVPTVQADDPEATEEPEQAEEEQTLPETYTVQPGDTMFQIATRFGTTPLALAQLNGIANPSQIYIGQELRLTGTAPEPISGSGDKLIVVNLTEQRMYVYQGDVLLYTFIVSTGKAPYYTRAGEFRVQSKFPRAWGSTWNIWMPSWLGIYWAGSTENGIHALPETTWGQVLWAQYLGLPQSFGCIVLGTQEAALLYEWAEIGTPVSIRY